MATVVGTTGNETLLGNDTVADSIWGNSGTDIIYGGTAAGTGGGNDLLDGGAGADVIYGGDGNDTLIGGNDTLNDTLFGGAGTDTADYSRYLTALSSGSSTFATNSTAVNVNLATGIATGLGTDSLSGIENVIGGSGADTITGDTLANRLDGGAGADLIDGGAGADSLFGGTGNDTLIGGAGSDSLDGGADFDIASYATSTANMTITLGGTATGDGSTDTLTSIEGVIGGSGNDTITGDSSANRLEGGDGNDIIDGAGGSDTLYGDAGDDTVYGGTTNAADFIYGGNGNDLLFGYGGADSVYGDAGNDTLFGGSGGDRLDGGADFDFVNYSDVSSDMTINLTSGSVSGDGADTLVSIEGVIGGTGDDTITGDGVANVLDGGAGADSLSGAAGNDTLYGAAGNDTIYGGADADLVYGGDDQDRLYGNDGLDTLYGGLANDTLDGGAGDDTLVGGAGADSLIGGTGTDTADYSASGSAVNVNMSDTLAESGGDAAGDTLSGIENLTGSSLNDTLTGDNGGNVIDGGANSDLVHGGAGNDTLIGGAGNDTIDGGVDSDTIFGGSGDDLLYGGTAAPVGTTYIINGSFDSGSSNWSGTDIEVNPESSYLPPGTAGNVAEIDGNSGQITVMKQSFVIDGALTAQLTFKGIVRTAGTVNTDGYRVDVLDASGAVIATMNVLPGSKTVWADYTLGINFPAAGTYTLQFTELGNNDSTGALVDDIQITSTAVLQNDLGDALYGEAGNDTLYGEAGADIVSGGDNADLAYGGTEADTIYGDAGNDTLYGDAGDDRLFGGDNSDLAYGGVGLDTLYGDAGTDTLYGGDNADLAYGGTEADAIYGDAGNDTLYGDAGDDTLYGGAGNDSLEAGVGNDVTYGDDGDDTIRYGSGDDTVYGGAGNDNIDDESGTTHAGANLLYGGAGNDTIWAGENDDTLHGDAGNDTLYGENGNDRFYGGANDDLLIGGTGNDTLYGGAGLDDIYAGDDRDLIHVTFTKPGDESVAGDAVANDILGNESVDGGSGPGTTADNDTLTVDITGMGWTRMDLVYTSANHENGIITFFNGAGVQVGTLTFTDIENLVIVCFTAGTQILTDRGAIAVETLVPGDLVVTRDNGLQPLRWVGSRHLSRAELQARPALQPVRISAGALPEGPDRSMLVSPQHRVLIEGMRAEMYFGESEVLVPAKHLTGLAEITRALPAEGVTYVHILFDRHEIVQSDGIWTESFQPAERTLNALDEAARTEVLELFPELAADATGFPAARLSLKAHEAKVLVSG